MPHNKAPLMSSMRGIIEALAAKSTDSSTLLQLHALCNGAYTHEKARSIFDLVREKSIHAVKTNNCQLASQYAFEEICAKTLVNLKRPPACFDPDSPYWIIPCAIVAARHLNIADDTILKSAVA